MAARREGIVRVLDASGRVEVGELAQRLGVAEETVRRDLRALEQAGRLRRAHGGAIANERGTQHPDAGAGDSNHDAVRAVHGLAAAVAGCIADGDAVYLDGGAVGEALAGMLSSGVGADERARAGASAVPVAGRHADARAGASAVAAPGASGGVDMGASGGADAAGGSPARAASGVRIVTASVPVAMAAALAADPPEVHLLGGQVGGDGRASGQWTRDLAG
ncbi:DeoR family transcriptional regulator, partial [Herbiconiux sp.]|uniref:DeoR family transcriptional regulator n=1 Tax=Herbiconiux sp. TaxID=1871186 RepID=UPI0025BBEC93